VAGCLFYSHSAKRPPRPKGKLPKTDEPHCATPRQASCDFSLLFPPPRPCEKERLQGAPPTARACPARSGTCPCARTETSRHRRRHRRRRRRRRRRPDPRQSAMAQRKLARMELPPGCADALRREGVNLAKVRSRNCCAGRRGAVRPRRRAVCLREERAWLASARARAAQRGTAGALHLPCGMPGPCVAGARAPRPRPARAQRACAAPVLCPPHRLTAWPRARSPCAPRLRRCRRTSSTRTGRSLCPSWGCTRTCATSSTPRWPPTSALSRGLP
jgi:hypothetical protein